MRLIAAVRLAGELRELRDELPAAVDAILQSAPTGLKLKNEGIFLLFHFFSFLSPLYLLFRLPR